MLLRPDNLSAETLSAFFPEPIVSFSNESIGEHRGLVGAMTRIIVNGKNFILKVNKPGAIATRAFCEAKFYTWADNRADLDDFPKIVAAGCDESTGDYFVLMEDMTTRTDPTPVNLNLVFGNQIWGGVPPHIAQLTTQEDALTAVVTTAARRHAAFWKDPRLLESTWMRGAAWFKGQGRNIWERSVELCRERWEQTKKKQFSEKFTLSPKLAGIIDRSLAETHWDELQRHLQDPAVPFTLTHGDWHASNMFLLPPNRVVVFDWTEAGPWEPGTDLAQMIISDVRPAVYAPFSRELITRYHAALVANGVKDYSFDQAWESFCRGVNRWLLLFPFLATWGLPDTATAYFQDQILAFIENHNPRDTYPFHSVIVL